MGTEYEPRRLSLTRMGTGNPKSSKNAHPTSQPKPDNLKNATRTGPSQSDPVFSTLKDKWDHREGSEEELKKIFKLIIGELKKSKSAIRGVESFLEDEKMGIDDCVKWYLLFCTVDYEPPEKSKEDNEKKARLQLVEALMRERPYLAFENINNADGPSKLYSKTCNKEWHKDLKEKKTPLNRAITQVNSSAVQTMIERGEKYYDEKDGEYSLGQLRAQKMNPESPNCAVKKCRFTDIMKQKDQELKDTPLKLAEKWDSGKLEIINALLGVPGIVIDDPTFDDALREKKYAVVEAFLSKPKVAKAIVTKELVLRTLGKLNSKNQSDNPMMKVAKLMVKFLDNSLFDLSVAEKIIQCGSMDMWKAHNEDNLDNGLKECLLHLAVRNQQYEFVRYFVTKDFSSVAKEWEYSEGVGRKYPLWYNNHDDKGAKIKGQPDDNRTKIRDEITTKMIQTEPEMGKLCDMFNSCEEPVGELCFDLSRFDSAGFQVSAFIDSMISQHQTKRLLKFEKTLRYAEFPPLDALKNDRECFKDSCYLQQEHTEVFRILEWLRDPMGVETIIELKVPDRLVNSHNEDTMVGAVKAFKVQVFDWKTLDLCLDGLSSDSRSIITDLHLYSSGKRSVINHWFGPDGLEKIPELKVLRINIVQETCTSDHLWNLKEDVEKILEKKKNSYPKLTDWKVDQISWYPKAQQANLMKIAQRVDPKLGRWLENLNQFYEHDFTEDSFKPTKVAILDDGVLSVSPTSQTTAVSLNSSGKAEDISWAANTKSKSSTSSVTQSTSGVSSLQGKLEDNNSLSSRIKGGRSFVAGGSSHSPWHLACNPHGTQMANLICAMDPLCEIYVARVAEDALGITADRVVKAIDWAIEMGVDIISMSFTIGAQGSLAKALDRATAEGIVMTCSTHDEGSKTEEAWPASYIGSKDKSLFVLAACDEYGRTLRNIDKDKYHFLLPGQKVSAGNIPFLKADDTISGSSVATALAAGICSLTLTCDRLAISGRNYQTGMEAGSRYERVRGQLEAMKSNVGSEQIVLRKFGMVDTGGQGAIGYPRVREYLAKVKQRQVGF